MSPLSNKHIQLLLLHRSASISHALTQYLRGGSKADAGVELLTNGSEEYQMTLRDGGEQKVTLCCSKV